MVHHGNAYRQITQSLKLVKSHLAEVYLPEALKNVFQASCKPICTRFRDEPYLFSLT